MQAFRVTLFYCREGVLINGRKISEETKIELKTTAANPRFTGFILLLLPLLPDIQFRKGSAPEDSAES